MNLRPDPERLGARLPRRTVRLRLTALYGGLFLASGIGLLVIVNLLTRGWPWAMPTSFYHGPHLGRVLVHGRHIYAVTPQQLRAEAARQHAAAMTQLLVVSAIALGIMAVVSAALGWLVAGRVLRPLREMTTTARAISEDNLHQRLAVPGPGDELKDLGDTIDSLLDRLEGAFDAQRNFVASASHELRTPLTLTRTLLQMALTDPHPTLASYRSTCHDLLEASDQQEQLIEALLTLARSQRGLEGREPLDLATITTGVLHVLQPQADARQLAISTSISTAPILGDDRLLQRLVSNLIDNAIRHNNPNGQISIHVTADEEHPVLKITNTGPVVPSGHVNRLLQPFQRLPATRPANAEGLGLGLSIVAAIAKAHHATLTVNPQPHGGLDIAINFPPATPAIPTPPAALTTV